MAGITHEVAEERSLALHREVARRLREKPELLERARGRVARWRREGGVSGPWADAWSEVLAGTLEEIVGALTDPGRRGRDLRQTSPFAGALDSATRWRILRDCERERVRRDQGSA